MVLFFTFCRVSPDVRHLASIGADGLAQTRSPNTIFRFKPELGNQVNAALVLTELVSAIPTNAWDSIILVDIQPVIQILADVTDAVTIHLPASVWPLFDVSAGDQLSISDYLRARCVFVSSMKNVRPILLAT